MYSMLANSGKYDIPVGSLSPGCNLSFSVMLVKGVLRRDFGHETD